MCHPPSLLSVSVIHLCFSSLLSVSVFYLYLHLYFPPVIAIPSINCFWNTRYRITMGTIARTEPADVYKRQGQQRLSLPAEPNLSPIWSERCRTFPTSNWGQIFPWISGKALSQIRSRFRTSYSAATAPRNTRNRSQRNSPWPVPAARPVLPWISTARLY